MSGTKERAEAKEIKAYLGVHMKDAIFISRKETNSGALVLDKNTGRVILSGTKNYEILEKLTDPNESAAKRRNPLLDIPQTKNIRKETDKAAVAVICWINELEELTGDRFHMIRDADGRVNGVKGAVLEFTRKGMKEEK